MGRLPDVESNNQFNDEPPESRFWMSMITWCAASYCCMLLLFIYVSYPRYGLLELDLLPLFVHGTSPALFYAFSQSHKHFDKPRGIDVIALVPFQEVKGTEILDCYLQRNLASNGGLLDHVIFIPQTSNSERLEWLAAMVERARSYSISDQHDFGFAANERDDALFLWINGAVFLEEHTIPTMVKTKLDYPDSLIVSANVVNEGPLSHPSGILSSSHQHNGHVPPLREPPSSIGRSTPFGRADIGNWTTKAQQHYSFLHHLKLGNLYPYKFPMWANPTGPISTNFFCFMGRDAPDVELFVQGNNSHKKSAEDGGHAVKNRIIIDGKGVVAHYSLGQGSEELQDTDVLQRYRAFARENFCPDIQ